MRLFLALDIGVVLFALGCAALGLLFFYRNVHRAFTKNAPAIAHITYKKHTVQRRFSERFLWGQTVRDTPLYNGDLVRTAALSDASIVFNNNDTIALSENTLIQIFYTEKGTLIDLNSGKLDVKAASGNMNVKVNKTMVHPQIESSIQVETSAGSANVRAQDGSAVLEQNGVQQTLTEDSSWTVESTGKITTQDTLAVRSPLPDSTFVISPSTPPPYHASIPFEWSTEGFTPKEYIRLEASRFRNFDTVEQRLDLYGTAGANLQLGTGDWWWRAWRPERENPEGFIANGKFFVVEGAKPANEKAAENLGLNTLLENLNAENPVSFEEETEPEPEPPAAPGNLRPPENFLFGTAYLKNSRTFVFSCAAVPGAESYIWTFAQNGRTITRTTKTPQCRLDAADAARQFQNGLCRWAVEAAAVSSDGAVVRGQAARSYFRLAIPPAPAPVPKTPVEITQ
jgi:hypothetical protein